MSEEKRYFWVTMKDAEVVDGKFKIKLPPAFCDSKNPRQIIVMQCKATYKNTLVGDIVMHADFIKDDHWFDYAVCFINEEPNRKTAKFAYKDYRRDFSIWFSDLDGNSIHDNLDAFALRMLLIY